MECNYEEMPTTPRTVSFEVRLVMRGWTMNGMIPMKNQDFTWIRSFSIWVLHCQKIILFMWSIEILKAKWLIRAVENIWPLIKCV
jgi:hypothetical protein